MRKLVASRVGRTALTAGLLSVGMLSWGIAQAASGPNTAPGGAHPIVPATTAGMPPTAQTLYAVVNADGTKARSFPSYITTSTTAAGEYLVNVGHPVSGCAFVASLGQTGSSGVVPAGSINAEGAVAGVNDVFVQTLNSSGTPTAEPFHLAILC